MSVSGRHLFRLTIAFALCLGSVPALAGCGSGNTSPSAAGGVTSKPTGVNEVLEARMTEEQDFFADYEESTEDTTPSSDTLSEPLEPMPGIDVDLASMSGTIVYSEVFNMMTYPSDYVGKTIRMRGEFVRFDDETTGHVYYACIIQDATACCAQGIEFKPNDDYKFPDDFPAEGDQITVKGVFSTYMEGDTMYCTLKDSEIL